MPNIAVIGCGYWGKNHIATLHSLNALFAVCDLHVPTAKLMGEKYNVAALSVEEIFCHPDIEGVVLALPPQYHAENIIKAVSHGKDVLVEKPISLEVEAAQKAVDAAHKHQRILMVGHLLRFHPAFEKMLSLIEEGAIGELRYISAHRLGFGKFHDQSDAVWDLGPHDLSMILALAQSEPIEIYKEGTAIVNDLLDFSHIHMGFERNIKAHLYVSRLSPYIERKLTVIGTKAMLVFDDLADWPNKLALFNYSIGEKKGAQWDFTKEEARYFPVTKALPLTEEIKHFLSCIEERKLPRTNGEEALATLRILNKD